MSEAPETQPEPAIICALRRLPPIEQHQLFEWSKELGAIRYGPLSGGRKAAAILALTRERRAAWPLFKVLFGALWHLVWVARSWTFRLTVGVLIVTFVVLGNAAAGSVALGGGIRLPLWILIGTGAALTGLLADQLAARMKRGPAARSHGKG